AHGDVVLTGYSQGAGVALRLALAGDVVPATAVIAVGPAYPPSTRFPEPVRTLRVVFLRGAEARMGRGRPATAEWLRAAGHRVHSEEVPGFGHAFPDDFAERLPGLLAEAGVRAP